MSDKLLKDTLESSLGALKAHLRAHSLYDVIQSLEDAQVHNDKTVSIGEQFLNAQVAIDSRLYKTAESQLNFLFIMTARPTPQSFAESFPEMLPYNPWGMVGIDSYPFPGLQGLVVDNIEWQYVFFSTGDADIQKSLWQQHDPKKPLASLKTQTGIEADKLWTGGLYYTGDFVIPWQSILPAGADWNDMLPKVAHPVSGCIFHRGVLPFLKMRVDLLKIDDPFGDGIIKNISLAFEFSSSLSNGFDTTVLFSKGAGRSIGLSGIIQIGNTAEITIGGFWPLDGDDIVITASCKLKDLENYLPADIPLPKDIETHLLFSVSKRDRKLNKIAFQAEVNNWNISNNLLELNKAYFNIRVFPLGKNRIILTDFTGKATLGSVPLICSGSYPDGIYELALDTKEEKIDLGGLLQAVTGIDLGQSNLELAELSGTYNSAAKIYNITVSVEKDGVWTPDFTLQTGTVKVGKKFELNTITANIKGSPGNFFISLRASFSFALMNFDVQCVHSEFWFFSATYIDDSKKTIKELATIIGLDESNIPGFLNDCRFKSFSLNYNTKGQFSIQAQTEININNITADASLQIEKQEEEFDFSGQFSLDENTFNFSFLKDGTDTFLKLALHMKIGGIIIYLSATDETKNNKEVKTSDKTFIGTATNLHISIIDAISSLTGNIFEKPDWLPEITINEINCKYDSSISEMNMTCKASAGGHSLNLSLIYKKEKDKNNSIYALAITTDDVSFGGLPVVGEVLDKVSIKNFGFVYASESDIFCASTEGDYKLEFVTATNNNTQKEEKKPANLTFQKGFNFSGHLNMPFTDPFTLSVLAEEPDQKEPADSSPSAPVVAENAFKSNTNWYNLNKVIGPVTLQRVGFQVKKGTLELMLTAQIEVGPLTFSLIGLGVSFSIAKLFKKEFNPSFGVDGLGLSFKSSSLEIGGTFVKTISSGGQEEFNGTALVKSSTFALSALGSYTKVDGKTSLFVYGYLEKALGGPSFFFVEGLAFGFGYNRKLLMPRVEDVASFPLIQQVMGGSPNKASNTDTNPSLQQQLVLLDNYLPATPGELFLVAGVKFSTFKLINSFALLSVSFGRQMEVNVLGQSNLTVPISKDGKKVSNPLAEINILLAATYLPDEGFLGVNAQLANDSYIFSKDCHLTGGAAFYSWFKGEHEGDFVVTMGGYHPNFHVPAHYPQVPRLALNWQISSDMSIKGNMYFALCPHAFMAGGHLEALYESGPFKAWFKAGADFLITWQPYHYEASIYVEIGASLHVDCGLFSFTISIEVGADVEIWGPDFSGEATVHIYGIDVPVSFGSSRSDELKPIDWDVFVKSSLPADEKILGITIINGEHGKSLPDTKGITYSIINPKELQFSVSSAIPVKDFKVIDNKKNFENENPLSKFGIAPMDKSNDHVTSSMTVCIFHNTDEPDFTGAKSNTANFIISENKKKMPASIWGTSFRHDLNEAQRLIEVVDGLGFVAKDPEKSAGIDYPTLDRLIVQDNPSIDLQWPKATAIKKNDKSKLLNELFLRTA